MECNERNKLAPFGTGSRLLLTANFKVTHGTKTMPKIKNLAPISCRYCALILRIRVHSPAPVINGGGDSLAKWPNFRLSRAHDLDRGSGHTAYHHASLIDLYLQTKFHWSRRNFVYLRTDRRMYGRTFEIHFIRSTRRMHYFVSSTLNTYFHMSLTHSPCLSITCLHTLQVYSIFSIFCIFFSIFMEVDPSKKRLGKKRISLSYTDSTFYLLKLSLL